MMREMNVLQGSIHEGVSASEIESGILDLSENSDLIKDLSADSFTHIVGQVRAKIIFQDILEGIISGVNIDKDSYEKPIASMIFAGPSGVGKTLFAKVAQKILNDHYGNDLKLLKINCADFPGDSPYPLNRLKGASAGFIGSDRKPIFHPDHVAGKGRVILFDEIEKAGSPFWNLLLAILDDGVLDIDYTQTQREDSGMKLLDGADFPIPLEENDKSSLQALFKDSLVIMTSNVGNAELEEMMSGGGIGFGTNEAKMPDEIDAKKIVMEAFEKKFLIEMQGRINHVVPFDHLTKEDANKIITLILNQLITNTLSTGKGFMIEFSDSAKSKILDDIYASPDFRKFGGRAIEEYFKQQIIPYIARAYNSGLLSQDPENPCCLLVTTRNDEIAFSKISVRDVTHTSEKVQGIVNQESTV